MFGAVWAQAELRKVLGAIGARVTEGEVAVGQAAERFDQNGRLSEPNLEEEVREVVSTLLSDADAAKTCQPPPTRSDPERQPIRTLGGRGVLFGGLVAFGGAVDRAVRGEPFGDPHDFAAQRDELLFDCRVFDAAMLVEDARRRCDGNNVWDIPRRSARMENSIVLIAWSPCVPPAALISPMTLSCRNRGSRVPSSCSQSSAFLNAPEIVP